MSTLGEITNLSDAFDVEYDNRTIKRGEIYYVDLEDIGYGLRHIQTKTRPALIIQNDIGNLHSDNVIVALITSVRKKDYPFQCSFTLNGRNSVIMFEQIMTLDKFRIKERAGELTYQQMKEAEQKLMYSLQLNRLSFNNIVDFEVVSVIMKKTRTDESVYFEIAIYFEYENNTYVNISLEKLQQFNDAITEDTNFDTIKKLLDNCQGLHWIFTDNEV